MNHQNNNSRINCKVLIVDDEGDVCYLLSKLLAQKGVRFDHVNTLAQAETALKDETPDIIFLDHNLPDGLGINFIDLLRSNYPQIRIVMITAHDSIITKNRALKKGADFFIAKPFTSDQIFNCIEQLSICKSA